MLFEPFDTQFIYHIAKFISMSQIERAKRQQQKWQRIAGEGERMRERRSNVSAYFFPT